MDYVNQIIMDRRKGGHVFTTFQEKELFRSFFNNCKLTKDVKINLSNRLGLPQNSVVRFFWKLNRKPRNESMAAYLKLLQGEI